MTASKSRTVTAHEIFNNTVLEVGENNVSYQNNGETHYFKFVPEETCAYRVYSKKSYYIVCIELYDENKVYNALSMQGMKAGEYTGSKSGDAKLTFNFEAGKTYYIGVFSHTLSDTIVIKEWEHVDSVEEELPSVFPEDAVFEQMTVGEEEIINLNEENDYRTFFSFEVTDKKRYSFYSKAGIDNIHAFICRWLEDEECWIIDDFGSNYFIGDNKNEVCFSEELDAGKYYIQVDSRTCEEWEEDGTGEPVSGGIFCVQEGLVSPYAFEDLLQLQTGKNEISVEAGKSAYYLFEAPDEKTYYFYSDAYAGDGVSYEWLDTEVGPYYYGGYYNYGVAYDLVPGTYCLQIENNGDEDKEFTFFCDDKKLRIDSNTKTLYTPEPGGNILWYYASKGFDFSDITVTCEDGSDELFEVKKLYHEDMEYTEIIIKAKKPGRGKLTVSVAGNEEYGAYERTFNIIVYPYKHTHEYQPKVIKQDCDYCEYTRYTCSICSEWYEVLNDDKPALGHNLTEYDEENGTYYCSRCGYWWDSEDFAEEDTVLKAGENKVACPVDESCYFKFVPEKTCVYRVYSKRSDGINFINLYDENKVYNVGSMNGIEAEAYTGSKPWDAKFIFKFEKGKTYYLELYTYSPTETVCIQEHEHTPVNETVKKAATCTQKGIKKCTCKFGCEFEESIDMKNHTAVKDEGKAATCTQDGLTEGSHCSVCNKVLVAQEPITAKGHTLVTDEGKAATCAQDGLTEGSHCSVCNSVVVEQTIIPATGEHSYGEWTVNKKATAIAEGLKSRKCLVCEHTEKQKIKKLAAKIKIVSSSVPMMVGQKSNLTDNVTGLADGDSIKSWSSSNKKIVTVDKKGKATAVATGNAKITVTLASGKKADFTVKVQKNEVNEIVTKSITNLPKSITLKKGKKQKLEPVLNPVTSTDKITYSTSNKKVVTVSNKGEIKAVKKGKATITVKAGKKSFKITVTVK